MKFYSFLFVLFLSLASYSQNYMKHNINLLSLVTPNGDTLDGPVGNKYSGCWGWYQSAKNKEYAISGTSDGTYFIDVTVPTAPVVCDFVPGRRGSTWREMKTYQNYCYIVCDDAQPNKFTIVDMQYLPDSVHIVHYGNKYFERGHTIYIDQDKMYIGATTYSSGSSAMTVWSLANPVDPYLLRRVEQDIAPPVFNYVHDMFVRNDTVYASTGWQGLHVLKFENSDSTFTHLGSYQGYTDAGYNHSSWLTEDGKHLVFCDEVPASVPIHVVDVTNLGNIQPVSAFKPTVFTTPHNPYLIGNKWAVVSCYQDGLYIYDISDPAAPSQAGYFDTYPQGGLNTGIYEGSAYKGNWGAYPYLPSGIIIANDMQNGVFILGAQAAFNNTVTNPVGVTSASSDSPNLMVFPNPAVNNVSVYFNSTAPTSLEIINILGSRVYYKNLIGAVTESIDLRNFANGSYMVIVTENNEKKYKKLIINH